MVAPGVIVYMCTWKAKVDQGLEASLGDTAISYLKTDRQSG